MNRLTAALMATIVNILVVATLATELFNIDNALPQIGALIILATGFYTQLRIVKFVSDRFKL